MELKTLNDEEFVLPEHKVVLVDYGESAEFVINTMKILSNGKKSGNANLFENGELVNTKEFEFQSFSSLQELNSELMFNKNSLLRQYIEGCIKENDSMFSTLTKASELMGSMYSDSGFLKILSRLTKGMRTPFQFSGESMTVDNLIALIQVETMSLEISDKLTLLTNILKLLHREQYLFLYININGIAESFIEECFNEDVRVTVMIDINCISDISIFGNHLPIILRNNGIQKNQRLEIHPAEMQNYIYAALPTTSKNYNFQREKIRNIVDLYNINQNNFLILASEILHNPL
ncbi:MAG: hypothetical protein ACK5LZ_06540 [Anaerorhabdus sp.]